MKKAVLLFLVFCISIQGVLVSESNSVEALSYENGRIAFVSTHGGGLAKIYTTANDGLGSATRLTNSGAAVAETNPVWSPDGTKIAYSSSPNNGDIEGTVIMIANADGTGSPVRLTDNDDDSELAEVNPTWSPDGTKVAFVQYIPGEEVDDMHIYIANVGSSASSTRLTDTDDDGSVMEKYPAWSPDGTKIAYTGYTEDGVVDDVHIFLADTSGSSSPARLTASGSNIVEEYPAWSPDGTKIAYSRYTNDGQIDDRHIYVANTNGSGSPSRLTASSGSIVELSPAWSPDGSRIAYSSYTNDGQIDDTVVVTTNADGSGASSVVTAGSSVGNTDPAWEPISIGSVVHNNDGTTTVVIEADEDYSDVTYTIASKETLIVNGKLGDVTVSTGGSLKGTGTVGALTVQSGGSVAPGQSPGCLTAGNTTFNADSSLDIELAGKTVCTEYDQLKITGTINLGNAALNVSRLNDFKPAVGDAFVIVANDGNDAITGTFNNLAEGATFTVDGYVFKVSYTGGDGNDAVITVQNVPTTPNTGMQLLTTNPLLTLTLTVVSAGALFAIAKRYSVISKK